MIPHQTRTPLRIDREGHWFFAGEEITHHKTYLLFCRSLARDPDGRYFLRIGPEACEVEVEDAPFVVATLRFSPSPSGDLDAVRVVLNDETIEPLDPGSFRIGPRNIPYCRVRGGALEARFSRTAYQLLFPYFQQDGRGRFFIRLGGREVDLGVDPAG